MTTPSPELKKLYLKIIRRVHPDGAVDEQDRLRCERLTQEANHAFAVGDEAALRAVLEPERLRPGRKPKGSKRPLEAWRKALIRMRWQLAGAAFAFVLVCGYIVLTVKPQKVAPAVQPRDIEERRVNPPDPHIAPREASPRPSTAYNNSNARRGSPSHNSSDLNRYLEMLKGQVEKDFAQHILDAPDGTSADIAVVIRKNGHPEEPHLMVSSGYDEVDSACVQSVEQIRTFGVTPTFENLTVNFRCTVRAR
jgi:hypothetical protein